MIENAYGVMPGTVIRPQEVVEWVSIGGITKIQLRQVPTAQVVQKMFRLASPVLNLSSLASCLLHQKNHKFTELTDGKFSFITHHDVMRKWPQVPITPCP